MSSEIKVRLFKYPDRKNIVMGYDDPTSGKRVTRSAGTTDEETAIGSAAVWEDELNSGRFQAASKVTWQKFVDQYTDEKLSTLAPHTKETALASLGHMKRVIGPDRLCKITAGVLSKFAAELRKPQTVKRGDKERIKPGMSEATIAHHLRHIKAALRWAEAVGMLAKAPKIEMPKRAKGQSQARSRAVTTEEYERLLTVAPKIRPRDAATWTRLVEGLWLSGLRLGEAVALSWDEGEPFAVDLLGKRPVFRIRSEGQKSGRDEVLPMTPDFAEFLLKTPEAERTGRVFMLTCPATGKPIGTQQGWPNHWRHRPVRQGGHQQGRREVCRRPRPAPSIRHPMGKAGYAGDPTAVDAAFRDPNHDELLR